MYITESFQTEKEVTARIKELKKLHGTNVEIISITDSWVFIKLYLTYKLKGVTNG